jgi:hypothetical protein
MSNNLNRFFNIMPKLYNAENSRVLYALLYAIALSDDDVEAAVAEAKNQLFVRTATGTNLDDLANSLGVQRPPTLGLTDEEFQNLIPNLSLKPKTIRKAFYDTADIFWGPNFSRTNVTSRNFAPFDVNVGDSISVAIDNRPAQIVKVLAGDIAHGGMATAEEMQMILSKIDGATASIIVDSITGNKALNIRTNTPGPVGKVTINASSMIGSTKVDFKIGTFDILDLDQRVAVYNINPNELLIEIPSIVPALRRTLRGSHHFHADATLAQPVPPANGIWQGSFFYNPSGSVSNFSITGQKSNLQQTLSKGQVYTSIAVDNTTDIQTTNGRLMFDFGLPTQEGPVKFRGIPNSSTILIDPSYTFRKDHAMGGTVNVLYQQKPYVPNPNGKDLAIYLTSPSGARQIVQDILSTLAAAGILITFNILSPKYKYLIDNPYTDE